ncbi:KR domain-containing protein [Podospora australis]|uniref:KR domain-containing protein n=1 Tax=Podospora australis TaxID=1536484 RepID=A0AAN6WPA4_9PEZI|nr:KR domain-containing protein [Podospora australis]
MRTGGFIFGNFSGWWLGQDDNRVWSPLLTIERWHAELRTAGFAVVDKAVLDGPEPFHMNAAIVRRVPFAVNSATQGGSAITILHKDAQAEMTKSIASDVRSRGYSISMIKLGDKPPPGALVIVTLDHESPFFENITSEDLHAFQDLARNYQAGSLLWLLPPFATGCTDPRAAQTIGALGVLRNENSLPWFTLSIAADEANFAGMVIQVLNKIAGQPEDRRVLGDREFLIDRGVIRVSRLEPMCLKAELQRNTLREHNVGMVKHVELSQIGSLSSLYWEQRPAMVPGDHEILLEGKAFGLTLRDFLLTLGVVDYGEKKVELGTEVAGIVTQVGANVKHLFVGDRVAGYEPTGCFSTRPIMRASFCGKIPDDMTFEIAASLPVVFLAAISALVDTAQLEAGQSVLIHARCGGVGLAAVELCKKIGAEIFITVGTPEKIAYATEILGIPRDHILNSRDDSFLQDIMRMTGGRGVDVVLNSLSGPLLHASWMCVAEFGKMVEIGNVDLIGRGSLDIGPLLLNRSYSGVEVGRLDIMRPKRTERALAWTLQLINEGKLQAPGRIMVFDASEVQSAFRWLQDGDHIGKAIVSVSNEKIILSTLPRPEAIRFDSNATYLITGELGGVGMSVALWMAEHGARNLALLSRSAGKSQKDKDFLIELESFGCRGIAVAGRADDMSDVKEAVLLAPSSIKGVVHLSMVQREGMGVDLTHEDWEAAVKPKVDGAWNLHNCLAGNELDFFVLASSAITLIYQPGESNYSTANTFLEAFVSYRRGLGLPASAMGICPLMAFGYKEGNPIAMHEVLSTGLAPMAEKDFLEFMEYSIRNQRLDQDNEVSANESSPLSRQSSNGYVAMNISIRAEAAGNSRDGPEPSAVAELILQLRVDPAVLESPETIDMFVNEIGRRVQAIMMTDVGDVDVRQSLRQLGVDSLMAVELRRRWRLTFGVEVTTLEIMGGGTLESLGKLTAERLKGLLVGENTRWSVLDK